jgi:hypothetical protein
MINEVRTYVIKSTVKDEHCLRAVFTQSVGHDQSGATTTDDDIVIDVVASDAIQNVGRNV